jgi:hypothetical protein
MWHGINRFVTAIFDAFLWPFQGLSTTIQVLLISIPATFMALYVFRFVSNQSEILRCKDRIKAHILELRIFQDDLRVLLGAQRDILRHTMLYMFHSLKPMAVMIIPFVLIIIQVEARYAYRPLVPGETTILTASFLADTGADDRDVHVAVPAGIELQTPALHVPGNGEVKWRVGAAAPGVYTLSVDRGSSVGEKTLVVGTDAARISPIAYRPSDIRALAYPFESMTYGAADFQRLEVEYPPQRAMFIGMSSATWLLFGATILFGFAFRGLVGVTF